MDFVLYVCPWAAHFLLEHYPRLSAGSKAAVSLLSPNWATMPHALASQCDQNHRKLNPLILNALQGEDGDGVVGPVDDFEFTGLPFTIQAVSPG
jgi:hypothetical protein